MKRAFLVAVAFATLFHLNDNRLSAQTDDLKFFKNFFVTGDYEVRGVGFGNVAAVDGFATGTINIPADNPATTAVREGVPLGADILGAYLYWQVVSDTGPDTGSVGVKFDGYESDVTRRFVNAAGVGSRAVRQGARVRGPGLMLQSWRRYG